MSFIHSVLTVFTVLDLTVWGLMARKIRRPLPLASRAAFHGFFVLQFAFILILLRASYTPEGSRYWLLATPLLIVGYIWHLLLAPLFLIGCLLGVTGESLLAVFRWRQPPTAPQTAAQPQEGVSRRSFLGTIAALAPPLLTFSLSGYAGANLGNIRIRRLTIPLPNLPQALDGMTIAHLSDLHVGQFSSPEMLLSMVDASNSLKADLTLFTGDLINHDPSYLAQAMGALRALSPEVVLCEGNHDQGSVRIPFEQTLKENGFCLLIDETVTRMVRGVPVQLLGLRWCGPANWQNRHDERDMAATVQNLLEKRDPAAFPILLAHHPHAWDYSGDVTLTLSGHTHGGQLMLSEHRGFGPAMFRYWTGLYTRPANGDTPAKALVVSNGLGNWFPLRINAPAELVHITLRRA